MPLSTPPPLPPQPAALDHLAGLQHPALQLRVAGLQLHLAADIPIDEGVLARAVEGSTTLDEVLKGLVDAWVREGYPAARVLWARHESDVYVLVHPGRLAELRGAPPLRDYFSGLDDGSVLHDSALERRRALASAAAGRAGLDARTRFVPLDEDRVALLIEPPTPGPAQTYARGDFNNFGNRFSSRYLVDAVLRRSFASGDELKLAGTTGLRTEPLSGDGEGGYREGQLEWSRVTRLGVWSADGRYASFTQGIVDGTLDGELDTTGLSFLHTLYADARTRWNLQLRTDRTHRRTEEAGSGQRTLGEQYGSVEIDTAYVLQPDPRQQRWELQLALAARRGLGRHDTGSSPAQLDYALLRPSAQLHYAPDGPLAYSLEVSAQFSHDILPEQQQWVLGGPDVLAAYLPGFAVGDRGAAARFTAHWRGLRTGPVEWRPAVFAEYGGARFNPGVEERPTGTVRLGDAGLQLGLQAWNWLDASLSAAHPYSESGLDNATPGSRKAFYFFKLAAHY